MFFPGGVASSLCPRPLPIQRLTDAECIGDILTALYYAMGLLHATASFTAPKDQGVTLRIVFACRYAEQRPALIQDSRCVME